MYLMLLLGLAAPAAAQEFQPTATLDTIVAQFTGKPIGEAGGARTAVDKRLRLANCPAPQLEWRTPARDSVVVRCMAPAWRIFVPVNAAPQFAPGVIAATAAPAAVKVEPVIRRGDAVTVEVGSNGFSISREGVAMNDAAPGARLAVKVDERQPPIQTLAVEPGRARLPGK